MKVILMAAVAAVAFAGVAWADPVEGTWKTQVGDGAYAHVKVS